ncbi:cyclophilin-like protein [Lindgomyces ingoldianus]|uniref:Cyclophilin-like protein n=1 Tax=Lindgomyces ingoldianus TaxID=673940 RepID=A0ACB6QVN3_9PLEO|nr:cyclophilin-like protein [Lindgomyces ingoldianus]KAF2471058.1 cyclophilin-like protein [Lindgomyces ingoldianus]
MSVLLETSVGDITIDLLVDEAPKCCENFLKLCKIKYYNFSPFHSIQPNRSFQTGDPIGPGSKDSDGGSSIWGVLSKQTAKKTFRPEFRPKLKHADMGTVSMATAPSPDDPDNRLAGSQFLVTLAQNVEYLNGKAAVFGLVVEGFDVLEKINTAFIDDDGRPLKDIRILHTVVLDDPYDDPEGLTEPPSSPVPSQAQLATVRIGYDESLEEENDPEALERIRREREARAQALTLEMVGDLPFAEVAPPENVLFVCKLNPVTQDEDLELIFSRFGKIMSCEVIRDKRTGDSLQYAFIEFQNQKDCEQAYLKMEGVLIDDHRIHVDFSQSVSRLADTWRDATNSKRKRGGFGGIENLERRRQYRGEAGRERDRDGYGFIQDPEAAKKRELESKKFEDNFGNGSKKPVPSGSEDRRRPRERRERETSYHDDRWRRDRSQSPRRERRDRHSDGRYEQPRRERNRSRDRYRDDCNRRDTSRDRYRQEHRGSDRRRRD